MGYNPDKLSRKNRREQDEQKAFQLNAEILKKYEPEEKAAAALDNIKKTTAEALASKGLSPLDIDDIKKITADDEGYIKYKAEKAREKIANFNNQIKSSRDNVLPESISGKKDEKAQKNGNNKINGQAGHNLSAKKDRGGKAAGGNLKKYHEVKSEPINEDLFYKESITYKKYLELLEELSAIELKFKTEPEMEKKTKACRIIIEKANLLRGYIFQNVIKEINQDFDENEILHDKFLGHARIINQNIKHYKYFLNAAGNPESGKVDTAPVANEGSKEAGIQGEKEQENENQGRPQEKIDINVAGNKFRLIAAANSFDGLYKAIKEIGDIQAAHRFYPSEELISIIKLARAGFIGEEKIPLIYGIWQKYIELTDKEQEEVRRAEKEKETVEMYEAKKKEIDQEENGDSLLGEKLNFVAENKTDIEHQAEKRKELVETYGGEKELNEIIGDYKTLAEMEDKGHNNKQYNIENYNKWNELRLKIAGMTVGAEKYLKNPLNESRKNKLEDKLKGDLEKYLDKPVEKLVIGRNDSEKVLIMKIAAAVKHRNYYKFRAQPKAGEAIEGENKDDLKKSQAWGEKALAIGAAYNKKSGYAIEFEKLFIDDFNAGLDAAEEEEKGGQLVVEEQPDDGNKTVVEEKSLLTIGGQEDEVEDNAENEKKAFVEIKEVLETMKPKEKLKLGKFLATCGFKVEKWKDDILVKKLSKLAENKEKHSLAERFFSSLSETYARDSENAQKRIDEIDALKKEDKKTEFLRHKLSNVGYLAGNIFKAGRSVADVCQVTVFSPLRYGMMASMAVARGSEAGKEARLKNIKVIDKSRVKDMNKAADEAWRIWKEAKKEKENITAVDLEKAYEKNIPRDLLKRLQKEPEPGQASGIISRLMRKHLAYKVDLIAGNIYKIKSRSISEEQKKIEIEKLFRDNTKEFKDYDRILSQYGTVDTLAMAARYGEYAGKAAVMAMSAQTLYLTGEALWKNIAHILTEGKLPATGTQPAPDDNGNKVKAEAKQVAAIQAEQPADAVPRGVHEASSGQRIVIEPEPAVKNVVEKPKIDFKKDSEAFKDASEDKAVGPNFKKGLDSDEAGGTVDHFNEENAENKDLSGKSGHIRPEDESDAEAGNSGNDGEVNDNIEDGYEEGNSAKKPTAKIDEGFSMEDEDETAEEDIRQKLDDTRLTVDEQPADIAGDKIDNGPASEAETAGDDNVEKTDIAEAEELKARQIDSHNQPETGQTGKGQQTEKIADEKNAQHQPIDKATPESADLENIQKQKIEIPVLRSSYDYHKVSLNQEKINRISQLVENKEQLGVFNKENGNLKIGELDHWLKENNISRAELLRYYIDNNGNKNDVDRILRAHAPERYIGKPQERPMAMRAQNMEFYKFIKNKFFKEK